MKFVEINALSILKNVGVVVTQLAGGIGYIVVFQRTKHVLLKVRNLFDYLSSFAEK